MKRLTASIGILAAISCLNTPLLCAQDATKNSVPVCKTARNEGYFLAFTRPDQKARLHEREAIVIATRGTLVHCGNDSIELLTGNATIKTGDTTVLLKSADNRISIAPHSAVTVINTKDVQDVILHSGAVRGTTFKQSAAGPNFARASQPALTIFPIAATTLTMSDDGTIAIEEGRIFMDLPAGVSVKTPTGCLTASKRGCATITVSNNLSAVNSCLTSSALTYSTETGAIALPIGTSCLVSPSANLQLSDGLARRGHSVFNAANKMVVLSEFSLPSLLQASPKLNRIVLHPHGDYERNLSKALLKATAAVQMTRGRKGAYLFNPPVLATK